MRIRLPFAGVFFVLLLVAGYAGLSSLQLGGVVNDKVLHALTFFLLTTAFYWIVDTSRRRTLNMALVVCTGGLGVGSEVVQALLPDNGRVFDALDIVANIVGSLAALALCSWYHKRMLERKRLRKYTAVPGDDEDGVAAAAHSGGVDDDDIELGHGAGIVLHDGERAGDDDDTATATTAAVTTPSTSTASGGGAGGAAAAAGATAAPHRSLDEELDNWDENAQDPWEEEEEEEEEQDSGAAGVGKPAKKRTD